MLPNKIFDLELKPRDFIVYSCLVRHKDNETHTCFPSRKLIAKECCITLRTVDKALASLQNLALIDLQNRKRMNNTKEQVNIMTLPTIAMRGLLVFPQMTFSIDVDTAGYTKLKYDILDGCKRKNTEKCTDRISDSTCKHRSSYDG